MASIKAAKDELERCFTNYQQNKTALERLLNTPNTNRNTRIITRKFTSFQDALSALNDAHTTWVSKAGFNETTLEAETYNAVWRSGIWNDSDDLCDIADDALQLVNPTPDPPVLSNKQQLAILQKKMSTLQLNVASELDALTSHTAVDTLNITSHKLYSDMLSSLSSQLGETYTSLSDSIINLSGADSVTFITQHEEFHHTLHKRLVDVRVNLARLAKDPAEQPPRISTTSAMMGTRAVEMEKCRAPTFSGKTLEYPEFKRSWNKVAAQVWTEGNQMEQMKLKVDDFTRKVISRCHNMKDVWDALDHEYGQEMEVVNAVNTELQALQSEVCSTAEYIVKLRNHLPGLEDSLKVVDGLDHLQTPDKVNILVAKFDERTLYDWEIFKSTTSGKTYDRFFAFICARYDSSRSTIARLRSSATLNNNNNNSGQNINALQHSGVHLSCYKCERWTARGGPQLCPACGNATPEGQPIGHCLEHCNVFIAMSPNQRSDCISNAKWCPVHLSSSHEYDACAQKSDPRLVCNIENCQKHHHKTLHGSTTPFIANVNSVAHSNNSDNSGCNASNVLLIIQKILTPSGTITSFFDNGSTCCLLLLSTASRLGLIGEDVIIAIHTVGGQEEIKTKLFTFNIIDKNGVHHSIKAFGVNCISNGNIETCINLHHLKQLFSPSIQKIWSKAEQRPAGHIELLIGLNHAGLHPTVHETRGNLIVYQSLFGSGFTIGGYHASINSAGVSWDPTVAHIRSQEVRCAPQIHSQQKVHFTRVTYNSVREYMESSDLIVPTPRRCNNCMKCEECKFRGHQMSLQEQYEYKIMEDNVEYEEGTKSFRVKYAFSEDPSILTSNLNQVTKIAERLERKLENKGLLNSFNNEFDKMLELGALEELTTEEMNAWSGPVRYASLQYVCKPGSATTPFRIVTNTSLSDRNGVSTNSILMKGPNVLSNQAEVLSRWRSYDQALCSDFTKAYYSMKTGELEMHTRRVLWRYGEKDQPWKHFGYKTVTFGDKPAGVYLDIVINKTVDMFGSIDQEAAEKIRSDRYVDDLATGGTESQIARFHGKDTDENFSSDGTLSQILSQGSLKLKVVVTSGEENSKKMEKLGNAVLGHGWDPKGDTIAIISPAIDVLSAKVLSAAFLTPRGILSIINKPHDLIGLVTPILIQPRVAYRNLFTIQCPLVWDDPVPLKTQYEWFDIFKLLESLGEVKFPRSTRPANVTGKHDIIAYFDGSDNAYAAVVYYRWVLSNGTVDVRLAASNAKVTPLNRISTPRSELNGAVLVTRLVVTLIKACARSNMLPNKVWFIGDSECTLASREKTSGAFGEYFGNRIGEIHNNQSIIEKYCTVGEDGEWWQVASKDNGADLPTKVTATIEDISPDSTWQLGLAYLYLPIQQWPMNRDFAARKDSCIIPSCEILKKYRETIQEVEVNTIPHIQNLVHENMKASLIDPFHTNDWEKLVHFTQLLLTPFCHQQAIRNVSQMIDAAEWVWFRYAMKQTRQAHHSGKLKNLFTEERKGVIVVVGRAAEGFQKQFGKDCLPVLMSNSRVAILVMLWAHYQHHLARDITYATSLQKAWIVGGKRLAASIAKGCLRCRFKYKKKVEQQMATLPAEIQTQCKPFTNIGVDLAGPLTVRAMTNKRASLKVWNVIFVCLNTKAVTMHLAPGYSTDNFMLAYTSHTSIRGHPTKVHSDRGSQLVAAGKGIVEFDWDLIAKTTARRGTTWDFAPAGGQWRNGAVEIFVKKFKESFEILYSNTRMNYAELSCAIKRIANVLNDRPLSVQKSSVHHPSEDFLTPLTSNMLILGRSGSCAPVEQETYNEIPADRISFVEELERSWWYQYKVQYFSSLVPTQKWCHPKRNICVGDVVLIEYKNKSFPGTYRLGRVNSVEVDPTDNLVRTCTVTYKLIKSTATNPKDIYKGIVTKEIRVPVQRLVLICPIEEQ